jgi:protein-S-isoprenylcysteine O-methyltransferase
MSIASLLGSVFVLSELGLSLFKRAKKGEARTADRGSLWLLWIVAVISANLAIATDHRVIDTGPYRYIRHPSYTGALMAFFGLGLAFRNWAALAVMMVPIVGVFLWRIRVEEDALAQALGDRYRDYMGRTKRLVPAIY